MYEIFCPNGLWQHLTIIIYADITVNVFVPIYRQRMASFSSKSMPEKKEMGFYVADIKTVNQEVNMTQYIKTMENTPKTQYLYL